MVRRWSESYKLILKNNGTQKTYVDKRGGIWEFILYPQEMSIDQYEEWKPNFQAPRGCNAI